MTQDDPVPVGLVTGIEVQLTLLPPGSTPAYAVLARLALQRTGPGLPAHAAPAQSSQMKSAWFALGPQMAREMAKSLVDIAERADKTHPPVGPPAVQ
jgi:hypothetical protein